MQSSDHPAYRPDIDGLRAVAVLAVVVFHAFPSILPGGFVGVDVFFVISGFLISSIILKQLERGSFSFSDFYSRRVRRIFPALLTVLALCFAFGWFALVGDEYMQLGKHIAGAAGFVSNFVLWKESGYFDNTASTKPLLHLWSLGIEEQFYILWPLALFVSWKLRSRLNTFVVISTLMMISFVIGLNAIRHRAQASFYWPENRFWELACGCALAYLKLKKSSLFVKYNDHRAFLGAILLVLGFAFISSESAFPGYWALLPTLGTAFMISAGSQAWLNRQVLSLKPLVWIGLISFPLYLWHWPLLSFSYIIQSGLPPVGIRAAAVLLALLLAWLTLEFIEKPIRFGTFTSDRVKAATLMVSMISIGSLGYYCFYKQGFEDRSFLQAYKSNKNELVRTPRTDDECLKYLGAPSQIIYCRYNRVEGSKETVALVGDSHAHVSFPGAAELLAQKKISTVLFANSDCPPFVGGENGQTDDVREACKKRTDQVWHTVLSKPEIKKVFIFSRGVSYLTGKEFGEPYQKINSKGPRIPYDRFQSSLQNTIEMLNKAGKKAYYVGENPEMGVLAQACIPRPLRHWVENCDIDKKTVEERQAPYLKLLKTLKNVTVIETIDGFCPNGTCHMTKNGELLYADGDHLSVMGSRFQAEEILRPYLLQEDKFPPINKRKL